MKVQAAALMLLVATSLIANAAAKCDRTGLDKETRGGTWDVYLLKEWDWVDYAKYAGCAAAAFVPGLQPLSALCAGDLVEDIYDAAHNYVAPPTETQLIDGLVAGGSELLSQDGRVVRMGVLGFTCKACNCRSCWKNGAFRFGDCKRCGEFCTPEPNRVGIFLAVRKAPADSGSSPSTPGGGGSSSGASRCITINNNCPTEYYASVGLANTWNDASTSTDYLRWWSQGWWKVPANTGSSPVRLCFNGISQFYLHFQNGAVTFSSAETSSWCIHSWKKYSIYEMDTKGSQYYNYYDFTAGVGGNTCSEMGSDYKDVTFYRFVYSSSSVTNYNININCNSRVASRAAAAGTKALRATASVQPTGDVAILPNPTTADIMSKLTDSTTTASTKDSAPDELLVATGPDVAVFAPIPQAAAGDDSKAEQADGSSDNSSKVSKGASP